MANDNGYLKLYREVIQCDAFYKARSKHKTVFLTMLSYVVWNEVEFIINGNPIKLLPGQYAASIRTWAKLSGPDISRHDVKGAIDFFTSLQFLGHEVRHGLSVITITHKMIYDKNINITRTASRTRLGQRSDTKEDSKNVSISSSKDSDIPCAQVKPKIELKRFIYDEDVNKIFDDIYILEVSQKKFDEYSLQFPELDLEELGKYCTQWHAKNKVPIKNHAKTLHDWAKRQTGTQFLKNKPMQREAQKIKDFAHNYTNPVPYPRNKNIKTYAEET